MRVWMVIVVIATLALLALPLLVRASIDTVSTHNLFIQTLHQANKLNYLLNHRIYAEVSAYTKIETCPERACITASGKVASKESVACPRAVRLGTSVLIGGAQYTCDDRTHRDYDGRWDLYLGETERVYQEALAFGVQTLPVIIFN